MVMPAGFSTDPRDWQGAKPLMPFGTKYPLRNGHLYSADLDVLPMPFCWDEWCIPTYQQNGSSCVSQAWTNAFECMIRRYIGKKTFSEGEQLDADAVDAYAREKWYPKGYKGGMYVPQGFTAMLDLGILPPGTLMEEIADTRSAICTALLETPLVTAHIVHQGWMRASQINGEVENSPKPDGTMGGHCTSRIGFVVQTRNGVAWLYWVQENSWGTKHGYGGLLLLLESEDKECSIGEGPYRFVLPDHWELHRGWEKYVVTKPV